MKRIFFLILIISWSNFAQKTIAELPLKSDKQLLSVVYLPTKDKVVCLLGKKVDKIYSNEINDVWAYDTDGFVHKLIENEKLTNCIFSPIETTFLIARLPVKNNFPDEYKLNIDGSSSNFFKINDEFRYFNDVYGLSIINQKNKTNVDLKNDELFLKVVDLFSGKSTNNKLNKPDLSKVENKTTTTYSEGMNFDIRINENNISFITKSINKNYKSASIYRSIYDLTGTKTNEFEYSVNVPKNYLIFSDNGGGISMDNRNEKKISELAINNYLVDKKDGSVYVYGLFGNEAKQLNEATNLPLGIYVFKFDNQGKLQWESIQNIIDVTGFNQIQDVSKINLSIRLRNNEVFCSVFSKEKKYYDSIIIDDKNGEKKSEATVKLDEIKEISETDVLKSDLGLLKFDNFKFDKETIYLYNQSSEFKKYLDNQDKSKSYSFKTFISKKGFWLVQSDNASECKLLLF